MMIAADSLRVQTGRTARIDDSSVSAIRRPAGELAELADWIGLYKRHREPIHSGVLTRLDTPGESAWAHGVVAADGASALILFAEAV